MNAIYFLRHVQLVYPLSGKHMWCSAMLPPACHVTIRHLLVAEVHGIDRCWTCASSSADTLLTIIQKVRNNICMEVQARCERPTQFPSQKGRCFCYLNQRPWDHVAWRSFGL